MTNAVHKRLYPNIRVRFLTECSSPISCYVSGWPAAGERYMQDSKPSKTFLWMAKVLSRLSALLDPGYEYTAGRDKSFRLIAWFEAQSIWKTLVFFENCWQLNLFWLWFIVIMSEMPWLTKTSKAYGPSAAFGKPKCSSLQHQTMSVILTFPAIITMKIWKHHDLSLLVPFCSNPIGRLVAPLSLQDYSNHLTWSQVHQKCYFSSLWPQTSQLS